MSQCLSFLTLLQPVGPQHPLHQGLILHQIVAVCVYEQLDKDEDGYLMLERMCDGCTSVENGDIQLEIRRSVFVYCQIIIYFGMFILFHFGFVCSYFKSNCTYHLHIGDGRDQMDKLLIPFAICHSWIFFGGVWLSVVRSGATSTFGYLRDMSSRSTFSTVFHSYVTE